MDLNKYICLNGKFFDKNSPILSHTNRAFKYADALFETIHAYSTELQYFNHHYERLTSGMKTLKMEAPTQMSCNYLESLIQKLLNKNRIFKGGRIRLTVFRNTGGLYTPDDNEVSFLIETEHLKNDFYVLNEKGKILGLYEEIKKPLNMLSNLKTTNTLTNVLAGIYKKQNNLDDCILLNEKGTLCETISSNIFLVNNNKIYTPPLSDGCVDGIMRKQILSICKKNNILHYDVLPLQEKHLFDAQEVFVTNAISGVQWILGYKNTRYYHKVSGELIRLLNLSAFSREETA